MFDVCTIGDDCAFKKSVTTEQEHDRVYQFLMGLDHVVYSTLITQILNTNPLPSINRVFVMVTQEESHKAMVRSSENLLDALGCATTTNAPTDPSKYVQIDCGWKHTKMQYSFFSIQVPHPLNSLIPFSSPEHFTTPYPNPNLSGISLFITNDTVQSEEKAKKRRQSGMSRLLLLRNKSCG
ncbi:hypothetical protein Fmac_026826 [Flemingia macrophylla]|uniref:Uncharacterized protein n=1 Tax=Flemingia macrophylla TaxID=520843 RepID=A0ABD1LG11_9FABA